MCAREDAMEPGHSSYLRHLRLLTLAFAAAVLLYAGPVVLLQPIPLLTPSHVQALLWGFGAVALLNLLTVEPVSRAMMGPTVRAFAVGRDPQPLLATHRVVFLVALARVEFGAILGLVLFFLSGEASAFWLFALPTLLAFAILWPRRETLAKLGLGSQVFPA